MNANYHIQEGCGAPGYVKRKSESAGALLHEPARAVIERGENGRAGPAGSAGGGTAARTAAGRRPSSARGSKPVRLGAASGDRIVADEKIVRGSRNGAHDTNVCYGTIVRRVAVLRRWGRPPSPIISLRPAREAGQARAGHGPDAKTLCRGNKNADLHGSAFRQ